MSRSAGEIIEAFKVLPTLEDGPKRRWALKVIDEAFASRPENEVRQFEEYAYSLFGQEGE